ncbi:hypothetical protein BDV96DRAFT_613974 [Lophiotrema nucula]|uniref:F-box domain-containing protein n=1 Tax=Lophiotrema nucula TaxID=690887 RepID=A0A6A5Z1T5_9PLEO|nr:hypothetical protein BDV96DRAFT_613974 [Lophiotrema nucula]
MDSPPFLRLPTELHRDIFEYLELEERVRLAMTNKKIASIVREPTHADFLAAETLPWAINKDLYTCNVCRKFHHLLCFSDPMRKGRRGRGGAEAATRCCVKCGVKKPGQEVTIMGQPHVLCRFCGIFTDHVGSKGACEKCLPLPGRMNGRSDTDCSDYHDDDDWRYSVKVYDGGKHCEELYGCWPHERID